MFHYASAHISVNCEMRYPYLLLILFLTLCVGSKAQEGSAGFMSPYLTKGEDTARNFEDSVIIILNAIRMHPKEVAHAYQESKYYDVKNKNDRSLLSSLQKMTPISRPLAEDTFLTSMARCHANSSGHASHVGHDRITNCVEDFHAECINYGLKTPITVVWELLEDHGVPDLGHRKILLSENYSRIGVAQAFHRSYRYISVFDLGH